MATADVDTATVADGLVMAGTVDVPDTAADGLDTVVDGPVELTVADSSTSPVADALVDSVAAVVLAAAVAVTSVVAVDMPVAAATAVVDTGKLHRS
jgi:hypothetical protein